MSRVFKILMRVKYLTESSGCKTFFLQWIFLSFSTTSFILICSCLQDYFYLLTWLTRRVCKSRSLPGRRLSQMRCWLDRTATPWHTQREHKTSKTWKKINSFSSWVIFHAKEIIITLSYSWQYSALYCISGRHVE